MELLRVSTTICVLAWLNRCCLLAQHLHLYVAHGDRSSLCKFLLSCRKCVDCDHHVPLYL